MVFYFRMKKNNKYFLLRIFIFLISFPFCFSKMIIMKLFLFLHNANQYLHFHPETHLPTARNDKE